MAQNSDPPPPRYQFFILGLHMQPGNRPNGPNSWRISLEDPRTAQRSGFTTLTELNAFLEAWMDEKARNEGGAEKNREEPLDRA
jgi:hypothetical protein